MIVFVGHFYITIRYRVLDTKQGAGQQLAKPGDGGSEITWQSLFDRQSKRKTLHRWGEG